jgi:hypothetical protein
LPVALKIISGAAARFDGEIIAHLMPSKPDLFDSMIQRILLPIPIGI